jgi:putative transposase
MSDSTRNIRVYKYRLYPSSSQETNLFRVLNACRGLYNMVVAERKYTWRMEKRSVTGAELEALGKRYRETFPYAQQVFSQTIQSVIKQVDTAYKNFFKRRKAGKKGGYPRFKSRNRFHSIEFKQYGSGVKLDGRRLKLFGVGRIPVRFHRPMRGEIKVVRIVHKAGRWFVCFFCEVADKPELPKTGKTIGLDMGVSALVTTSDGDKIDHPHFYRKSERKLKILQRSLARKKRGGKNRKKALLKVQRQHEHTKNQRRDFAHKLSHSLAQHYDLIGVEDLKIANMVRNKHLSKSILDAGWGIFKALLTNKAEDAGREVVFVDPAYTSKTCSNCGVTFEDLTLADRWVDCECGLSLDRDHNAALNVLYRALQDRWDASVSGNVVPLASP